MLRERPALMLVRAGTVPTVAEVMTRDLYAVAPDTDLATAAELLEGKRITGMPVVNGDGRPVGVITLADLIDPERARSSDNGYPLFYRMADGERVGVRMVDGKRVSTSKIEPGRGRVSDMMSPFVLSIESTASLVEAANRMVGETVHRLLVMDGGALVGIVTVTDLLRGFALLHRR